MLYMEVLLIMKKPLLSKIEIRTWISIKATKEPNARRKMEGNKDFENYLSNNYLWSSYCVLGSDDLKMKIPLEAHSLCGGGRYQLLQYIMINSCKFAAELNF